MADSKRTKDWAYKLLNVSGLYKLYADATMGIECLFNLFEETTFAISNASTFDKLLSAHVDQFNCVESGFNVVFCLYFFFLFGTAWYSYHYLFLKKTNL